MSIIIAENFADFRLNRGDSVMSTKANADKLSSMIPDNVFPIRVDSNLSSGAIAYRNTRNDGSPIDKHHPDDDWLAFVRGSWDSSNSYQTYIGIPALTPFTKDGKWCLSLRVAVGEYASRSEVVFGVWIGDGAIPVMTIDGSGNVMVGNSSVSTSLLAPSTAQSPMGIDVLFDSAGGKAKVKVYANNIMLGNVDLSPSASANNTNIGWNVKRTVSTKPNVVMSFVRDIVVTYEDGNGYDGRCGAEFYVQKMMPTADTETDWSGPTPHYELMSRQYPAVPDEPFLTAYMFGQREEFKMQSLDTSRGRILAAVSVETDARNTGTTSVPFEYTFRGIQAGVVGVGGGDAVPRLFTMSKNPETGQEWAAKDLDDFSAGFGIEARR